MEVNMAPAERIVPYVSLDPASGWRKGRFVYLLEPKYLRCACSGATGNWIVESQNVKRGKNPNKLSGAGGPNDQDRPFTEFRNYIKNGAFAINEGGLFELQ